MVSRGGRSKGCSNCRKRRVKCDETRPKCLRCQKRGLDCDGPKDTTWINQNIDSQSSSSPENAIIVVSTPSPPRQLPFDAFGETICLAYTRKNLLRGGPIELACNMADVQASPDPSNPGVELLRQSLLSLSVTFFGKQHRQHRITRQGYTQYGQVLQQLNQHLSQPSLQTTDETILTTLTCMLLEIFLPTGPRNFFKHHRGLEAIMALRGPPPTDATGDTGTIFRGLRILSIIGALAESRPSIYARDEWKNLPPQADATEPMILQHRIFTCLADCTQLMSERDALLNGTAPLWAYEPLLARVHSALAHLESLKPLYDAFNNAEQERSNNNNEIPTPPSIATATTTTTPFSTTPAAQSLNIANSTSATILMLYSTVHLCILQILSSLHPTPSTSLARDAAASTIAACLELKDAQQRSGAALESNTISFVATKIAWQALGGFDSPEGRRLARVVDRALKGVGSVVVGEREGWEGATPEVVRDGFFERFMSRVPGRGGVGVVVGGDGERGVVGRGRRRAEESLGWVAEMG